MTAARVSASRKDQPMTDPASDSELPEQQVAITVFATVRGVDAQDAGAIASIAVRHVLREASIDPIKAVVTCPHRDGDIPVRIHQVMETGMAAGNGYLWTRTTSKAYREHP